MKLRLSLLALAAFAGGCPSDPIPATGSLSRPSGLAHVARLTEGNGARSDVFIADTEAGGVRVLQLRRTPGEEGNLIDEHTFVRSTALFFPLIVPAGKTPTRLAASADGDRVYVLSPIENVLHVIETKQADFGASATQVESYLPLGEIALRDGTADLGLPIDLIVLPPRDSSEVDLVLVAFDGVEGDSKIAAFSAPSAGIGRFLDSAVVGASPRSLAVRTATPSPGVLVSSAGTDAISHVAFDPQNGDDVFGRARSIDAGGPTGEVVDAGKSGALALRLDRIAATIFDVDTGTLARSQRIIASPFTPDVEVDLPAHRGIADLWASPPVAAVHTTVQVLPGQGRPVVDSFGEEGGSVVIIAHADTRVSFVSGTPLEISFALRSSISRVDSSNNGDLENCGEPVPITCEDRQQRIARGEALPDPMCSSAVLTTSVSRARVLRAEYRGSMVREHGGQLIPTSTRGLDFELRPRLADLSVLPLQSGDNVLIQARLLHNCATTTTAQDVVAIGTVTSTAGETVGVTFTATSAIAGFEPCDADNGFSLVEYEIFPSGPEVVYSSIVGFLRGQTPRIGRVLARIPTSEEQGASVEISSTVEAPLNLRLSAATSFFTCTGTVPAIGALCTSNIECGVQRECEPSDHGACPGRCKLDCAEEATNCLLAPVERGPCTGVEIEISGTDLNVVEASFETSSQRFIPAAPDDVVFSPMRGSWIISYPAARSLLELQTDENQGFATRPIR